MPDSVRRGIRTFVQAVTAILLLQIGTVATDIGTGNWVPDVIWLKRVAISALIAGAVAIITFVHNLMEDSGAIPSVLKASASSGANPITHDPVT